MEKFRSKLILAVFLFALLFGAGVYSFIKYESIKKQAEVAPPISVDANQKVNEVSQEILNLINPSKDLVASKAATGTDPEILKLISPPEGLKSSTSTNEVSPEILKLISPPDKINKQ